MVRRYTEAVTNQGGAAIDGLREIMARLRDPESGCPWDLEQDFASISPYTIEEAYEVDQAIADGNLDALRDELGDLLFQVVFQARLGEELGAFDFDDVAEAIATKLVRRHPHVFADAKTPATVADQSARWEELKAAERAEAGALRARAGPFAGIPRKLPALARSAKIAGRLAALDVDWLARSGDAAATSAVSLDGLREAIDGIAAQLDRESRDAPRAPDGSGPDAELRHAFGTLLQRLARLARERGIDPERALREVDDATIDAVRRAAPAPDAT